MIKPHGSEKLNPLLVSEAKRNRELQEEGATLPSLLLNATAAANAMMLGAGYFNPLTGYMNLEETISVSKNLHMKNGLFWPIPIINITKDISGLNDKKRIALRDPNITENPIIAIMDIENIELVTDEQIQIIVKEVYGTIDI